jgi:signal transduction histidine kinase/DNA-binding response OmpR family regulator
LCRDLDWSASPLGPVASWSPVLRSTFRLCLDSGFPILINWGPEMVALYNDAFTPMLGGKHPVALGRSAKDTWPEAWNAIGTRLDDVLVRGQTLRFVNERQFLERNGYLEECYFTFSNSPIRDDVGTIVGLFTASSETTREILNERRMRTVRELGAISAAGTTTMAQTCQAVLDVLARTRESVPFAAAFLTGPGGATDRVAVYGLTPELPGGLDTFFTQVVGRVIHTGSYEVVQGLRDRFSGLIEPGPLGPLAPDQAVVLPLTLIGGTDPVGAAVLGVNPYRRFDEDLRSFFSLLTRQIRTTLTDAVAYETERHRAQVLAELDRAKMEFFQNVSHELRTPLTLLLAPLQDLLERAESGAANGTAGEDRDTLLAAVRAAERLRLMVDALLDFSGAEARTLAPDRRPTDLTGLTADVASMFRSIAERAGLRFDVDVPSAPVTAMVDRAMFSTIVTNLLSNAVKYTESGGLTIRLTAADDRAVLTVADTGTGIAPDEQARVFDRFHRVSTDGTQGGAGIGLALVADLVHAHLGSIELVSTPGRGSAFTVTLPLDTDRNIVAPASVDQGSATALGDSAPVSSARPRALLVEDDTDLRTYIARLMTRDGWDVEAVADAETALSVISGSTGPAPDLVLTDLMLPGRDGLHLVAELRRLDPTARLPLIVLTARSGVEAIALGMAAGADDYITKPFASQELLARLRANHELHQLREQAVDAADERTAQVRGGLQSNRVIGTAIGILMTTHRLSTEQGFALLVAASQHSNRKLRDLAADVISTGRLPFRPTLTDELLVGVLAPR